MLTTDSRGVKYNVSVVPASRRTPKHMPKVECFIIERVSDRPVDIKRKERAQRKAEQLASTSSSESDTQFANPPVENIPADSN